MKISTFKIAALAFPLLFVCTAAAAPVYNASAGTLSYSNSILGFGLSNTFTFTGPQPFSVQGSGATAVAVSVLQSLNVPFGLSLGLIIDDTGNETGPASANGINYGGSQYLDINPTSLTNSSAITLTAGHLTVSVPGTVSGELEVCSPDMNCPGGSNPGGPHTNPFDVAFGPLSGTLTVTYAQFNGGPQYSLTSAVFATPTPEPPTWLFAFCGVALLTVHAVKNRAAKQT